MTTVAVIGVGDMGRRIARRLLDASYDVVVWNRTPARTADLAEAGASVAADPAQAARRADAVVTMVADPSALQAVTEGPSGVAAGVDESTTVIEMSTVGPAAVAQLVSALPTGTPLLDAPVLGSLTEAESGSLRIFVGGPAPLVERWTPVLGVLGSPLHVGPLGAGAAAKLVANTTLLGVLGVLGEAVALADGLGLARTATFDVLAGTPLAAQAERRRAALETSTAPRRFSLALARKDADLVVDAARASGRDLRLAAAVRTWLADAEAAGAGSDDYSAVLRHIVRGGEEDRPPADDRE